LAFAGRISKPLVTLTEVSTQISMGALDQRAQVTQRNEIGLLAEAFNSMATQLQEFINSLEQRVAERTRNLRTASEVSRATTSLLDPDELLRQVVNLVRERFNLYYVGLFLLDPSKQFAVLRAGTGKAGRQMLARGHRLEVGGSSMIGRSIAREEANIALHVGTQAVRRYANPLLPNTRSEMAIPLRSRGQVIGAMTIQSAREAAFDETDIAVMQTMADQVAVTIDNAQLFAETQAALEEAAATHRRYLRRAWTEYTLSRDVSGYQQTPVSLIPLDRQILPEVRQATKEGRLLTRSGDGGTDPSAGPATLVEPIVLRGQTIGALGFKQKPGAPPWSDDDVALIQTVASQLAQAVENLRLSRETERRAAREQLIGVVTARMRESLDLDTVLQTTTREMREALGLHSVMIELEMADETQFPPIET
jgi:GAF domain-containing protein/HAMP domain-containing protein